jgi:hypothetical protein
MLLRKMLMVVLRAAAYSGSLEIVKYLVEHAEC